MYMYMYMYSTCVHLHVHVYICANGICTCTCTCTSCTCTCVYVHVHVHVCTCTVIVYIYMYMYTSEILYMCYVVHVYVHVLAHSCSHVHVRYLLMTDWFSFSTLTNNTSCSMAHFHLLLARDDGDSSSTSEISEKDNCCWRDDDVSITICLTRGKRVKMIINSMYMYNVRLKIWIYFMLNKTWRYM